MEPDHSAGGQRVGCQRGQLVVREVDFGEVHEAVEFEASHRRDVVGGEVYFCQLVMNVVQYKFSKTVETENVILI